LHTITNNLISTVDTVVDAIKVTTDRLSGMMVVDGVVYQFTANALELAPISAGGATEAKQNAIIAAVVTNAAGVDIAADIIALKAVADNTQTQIGVAGLGLSAIPKTGFKLSSDGLDSVSVAAPAGPAGNFREMVVQTWRRFFKRAEKVANTSIITYADDGTTVVTTQPISINGTNEVQGPAS